jgi:hypothetical protein
MRRPWIKIETATADKPEICAIATRLRLDTDTVVGKLVRLWSWAEVNRIHGNDIGVTKEFLDKLVGRKGFAEALEHAGWLICDGERLRFPNFERHNGNASKIRSQTAKRVERHRQRTQSAVETVTPETSAPAAIQSAEAIEPLAPSENVSDVITSTESLEINLLNDPNDSHESAQYETHEPLHSAINVQSSPEADVPVIEPTGTQDEVQPAKLPRLGRRNLKTEGSGEDQPLLF